MEPSVVADDLNEVSVIVNVAHRLLLAIRDEIESTASLQAILDDLNAAHDQLDGVIEHLGQAFDRADEEAQQQPRESRPPIH